MLLILAFAAVVFWVFTAVDCAAQPAVRHRGVDKPIWVLLVLVLPVVGGILWLTVGRASAASLRRRAPDDDPEFLRSLAGGRPSSTPKAQTPPPSRAEQDKRIRDLEQDLIRRDDDDDQHHHGRRGNR